jgi:hypothetical protein
VFIGIGKRGFIGGLADAQMHQFAQATAQAVANLAKRISMGELAEQHRDQLGPAAKTFGAPFRIVFLDQRSELGSGEMLEQLIEQTRDLYDGFAFLVGGVWRSSGQGTIRQRFIIGGLFFLLRRTTNLFWTRVKIEALERRIGLRRNATRAPAQAPEWRGRLRSPQKLTTMPLKPSSEEVIERWMLTIVTDGGVTRFDDLHIDEIDEQWKDRSLWVSAGLEAYRIAVALRNRHQLPFVVALGFSLEGGPESQGMDFHTPAEFAERLDWSPPSLYLFHPDRTPCAGAQMPGDQNSPGDGGTIQDLNPGIFGVEVTAETYSLAFKGQGSQDNLRSVFVEG